MNTAQYRAPGREHIPIYPRGFIAIRIIQLVLSILILALAAYSVALLAYDGNSFILAVVSYELYSVTRNKRKHTHNSRPS